MARIVESITHIPEGDNKKPVTDNEYYKRIMAKYEQLINTTQDDIPVLPVPLKRDTVELNKEGNKKGSFEDPTTPKA